MSEKWFGPIPSATLRERNLPAEPVQKSKRTLTIEANVPADALYKTYHMPGRFHPDYYAVDLLSDVLSNGQSSRLFHKLVKEKELFNSISMYGTGSIDPGLLVVSGRMNEGVSLEKGEAEVDAILEDIVEKGITEEELTKVKNQAESMLAFDQVEVMNRAMNLAFATLSGDPNLVNLEAEKIDTVTTADIKRVAREIFKPENSSVMYYKASKN